MSKSSTWQFSARETRRLQSCSGSCIFPYTWATDCGCPIPPRLPNDVWSGHRDLSTRHLLCPEFFYSKTWNAITYSSIEFGPAALWITRNPSDLRESEITCSPNSPVLHFQSGSRIVIFPESNRGIDSEHQPGRCSRGGFHKVCSAVLEAIISPKDGDSRRRRIKWPVGYCIRMVTCVVTFSMPIQCGCTRGCEVHITHYIGG
jgi:hypothetical protein